MGDGVHQGFSAGSAFGRGHPNRAPTFFWNIDDDLGYTQLLSQAPYNDHRLLEHKEIDPVVIPTPDREAHGALSERRQALVKAVRDNRRVCQAGMQARAIPHFQKARELVRRIRRAR